MSNTGLQAAKALTEITQFLRKEAKRREVRMKASQNSKTAYSYDVGLDVGAYEATTSILFTAAKILEKRIK